MESRPGTFGIGPAPTPRRFGYAFAHESYAPAKFASAEELEQRCIHLFGVDAVRASLDDHESSPLISPAVRFPDAARGTVRSSSPWMTRVGTSMRATSCNRTRTFRTCGVSLYLPAIALTAYARKQDADAAIGGGYDRHLPKPVAPADLVRAIKSMTLEVAGKE